MKPVLHPWLSTPEAYQAAIRATAVPMYKMPFRANVIGREELLSEALAILTECALPPRERLAICAECKNPIPAGRRKGAKYCSTQCTSRAGVRRHRAGGQDEGVLPPPAPEKTHIGSMHKWPEDQRFPYAVREVGLRLCHFVNKGEQELASSDGPALRNLESTAVGDGDAATDARELIEIWLEDKGMKVTGDETVEELTEAVRNLRGICKEYQ